MSNSNVDFPEDKNEQIDIVNQIFSEMKCKLSTDFKTEQVDRHIGDNIKFYREANNYSQEKLASRLHVDRTTIHNWENGKSCPDGWQMEDLAKLFKVDIKELHTKKVMNVTMNDGNLQKYEEKERKWLSEHPEDLLNQKIEEGLLELWEGDFKRDYVWVNRNDIPVIALELAKRNFCIFDVHNDYYMEAEDGFWPLIVYLKKDQIVAFKKAVSEILVYLAGHVTKYPEVVTLRRAIDRDFDLWKYAEKDKTLSSYWVICIKHDGSYEPVYYGFAEDPTKIDLSNFIDGDYMIDRPFMDDEDYFVRAKLNNGKWEIME